MLESVWSVLISNVALLVNIVVFIVSMVLGGGTALLNTVLEVVNHRTLSTYLLTTFDKEVMLLSALVCLFVCLLAGLCDN